MVGCGALGSTICEQLARAGVGALTVVDRDIVEWSNLQRQTLFAEVDARRAVPKAEAAKSRLAAINASVVVRAIVDDLSASNARRYAEGCDCIVDGLDNFATRFILNDCAVERRVPLVYGGAVGMSGMAAAILPRGSNFGGAVRWTDGRSTPCLRCLMPEPPAPGEVETCETAGVLGSAAGIAASIEAALAIRLIAEGGDAIAPVLARFDLASMRFDSPSIADAADPGCPCCVARRFDFLAGGGRPSQECSGAPRVLCGRNAVEIRVGAGLRPEEFERMRTRLGGAAVEVAGSTRILRLALEDAGGTGRASGLSVLAGNEATIAIVEGTRDTEVARSIVARWIGV